MEVDGDGGTGPRAAAALPPVRQVQLVDLGAIETRINTLNNRHPFWTRYDGVVKNGGKFEPCALAKGEW